VNLDDHAARAGLSAGQYASLLEMFVRATENDMTRLRSALSASQLERAAEIAHHIKGAAFSLELEDISEAAKTLETRARKGVCPDAGELTDRLSAGLASVRRILPGM